MPSLFALGLTFGFVVFLFRRDFKEKPNVTSALWIPFLWIFLSSTRFFSQWLAVFGFNIGGITVEDGSPMDAAVFASLIAAALIILYRRRVNVAAFFRNNRWVTIYLLFCLVACAWSDYPFVGFKRWFKLFGQPVMVLVLLTEPDPIKSFTRLLKRLAYLIAPLSICFIKYFPDIGRSFDVWSGLPTNTGVTTNKNLLGADCMILGLFFFWHLLQVRKWEAGKFKRNEIVLCLGLLAMNLWLLHVAQSATSLVCFALGAGIILFLGLRINLKRINGYALAAISVATIAIIAGVWETIVHMLGRNDTLTDRTNIWQLLLHWNINPVLGTGFEGFWLGERRIELQSLYPHLNEAHNGYLETYLNLGIIGVALTIAMLLATWFKARRSLLIDFEFGRFRIAYFAAFVIYNWTEAAFRTHAFPFFIFFLIAIDYAAPETADEKETGFVTAVDFEPA